VQALIIMQRTSVHLGKNVFYSFEQELYHRFLKTSEVCGMHRDSMDLLHVKYKLSDVFKTFFFLNGIGQLLSTTSNSTLKILSLLKYFFYNFHKCHNFYHLVKNV